MGLGLGAIDREYERISRGRGFDGTRWSESAERRKFPECGRGGCHRPGKLRRHWVLCDPCYDAIGWERS